MYYHRIGFLEAYPKASLWEAVENIGVHKCTARNVLKTQEQVLHKRSTYKHYFLVINIAGYRFVIGYKPHELFENCSFPNQIVWIDEYNFSNNGMYLQQEK